MSTAEKSAHDAGLHLAQKRWGPSRRFHVGDLSPERRRAVAEFIEAQRRAQRAEREAA